MLLNLTDIEQAIITAIKALGRNYLRAETSVASYGGEFDDDLADVVRRFPAVWVTFGGAGAPRRFGSGSGKWRMPLTFVVMVGARNVRNEQATRQGLKKADGTVIEVGSYQLIADVQAALIGQDLELPIDPFVPGKISTLFNTKLNRQTLSVFSCEFKTGVLITRPDLDVPWLQSVSMSFLLQPSDETPDVEASLEADVELEGDQGSFGDGSHDAGGGAQAG